MVRRRFLTQILAAFLTVIVIGLAAFTWEVSRSMRSFHLEQTEEALEARARIIEIEMAGVMAEGHAEKVDALCKEIGGLSKTRITVILPSGKVVGDSDDDPVQMDNHGDRPEVREALAGRTGRAVRYSHTLKSDWVYLALPVAREGVVAGVIRVSTSLASVDSALRGAYFRMALSAAAVALLSVMISILLTRRIVRPIGRMVAGTRRLAAGDFDTRLAIPSSTEFAELATAMNQMAAELRERIEMVNRQRGELDAVLSSMAEGTLAVGRDERIIGMNRAAALLFGVDARASRGQDLQAVVRNPKLQACVSRVLETGEPFQLSVILYTPEERSLLVSATGLRHGTEREWGALLVLEDVTELRRLERVRSDFVANVSHELRTPVTSIKGYAETLLGEARQDPETLEKFLGIIARQSDRLTSLVDDILSLARLERSENASDTPFERIEARAVVEAVRHLCEPKAASQKIVVETDVAEGLFLEANPALAEQALGNLIDNAIKYSAPGGMVRVEAQLCSEEVLFSVIDHGVGIASDHLSRIFERFYRVDRGRSRAMGGTGLGLAIVKHIMTLHGGRVEVESEPGKGSRFTLSFPASRQ